MALVLSEEQLMLKDSATGFLSDKAPVAALRKLRDEKNATGYCEKLWREMVEMGWAGITIPEEFGGLGYGYTGLGIILEQVGRNLTASPLESTVLVAATIISEAGTQAQKETLLPAIASGELLVSLALQEGALHAPHKTATTAVPQGDGYVLNGCKTLVLDAHVANQFIIVARVSGAVGDANGLGLFLVDANQIEVSRDAMVDSRNYGTLTIANVSVSSSAILGRLETADTSLNRSLDIANIGLSAQLLGLSMEAYERTLEYLKQREQFGELIGSFQALQHRAAEMYTELELCKSMVLRSLQAIDNNDPQLSLLATGTKAKLCEVAEIVTNESIQMHGGIGMTDEFEIGFFIKRARAVQVTFGGYSYHMDRFAKLSGF